MSLIPFDNDAIRAYMNEHECGAIEAKRAVRKLQLLDGAEQNLTFTGTAANTSNASTTTFYIGQDVVATTNYFSGDIGEIVMVTTQLGSTSIEAVESFLMKRWGITPP